MGSITIEPSLINIFKGLVPGHFPFIRFAELADVDNTERDIWDFTTPLVYLTTAEQLNISSSDLNDTLLGTGCRTLTVTGLDANYQMQSETIDMDGTGLVPTVGFYLRVIELSVTTSAARRTPNIGNITANAPIAGADQAKMLVGNGHTFMSHYTVPVGHTLILTGATVSLGIGKDAELAARVSSGGEPLSVARRYILSETISNVEDQGRVESQGDILFTAKLITGAAGTPTSLSYRGALVKNAFLGSNLSPFTTEL